MRTSFQVATRREELGLGERSRRWLCWRWRYDGGLRLGLVVMVQALVVALVVQGGDGAHAEAKRTFQALEGRADTRGIEQQLAQLSASVSQFGARFSALESSLGQRLQTLSDTSTQENHMLNSLASRLIVVSALADRMDELERRFVRENSIIKSTIRGTSLDVQSLVTQLERFDGADGALLVNSSEVPSYSANSTRPLPADEALTDLRQEEKSSLARQRYQHQLRYQRRQQQKQQQEQQHQQQQQQQQHQQEHHQQHQQQQQQQQQQHQQQQQQQASQNVCMVPESVIEDVTQRFEKILTRALDVERSLLKSNVTGRVADIIRAAVAELNSQHRTLAQLVVQQTDAAVHNLSAQLKENSMSYKSSSSSAEDKKTSVPSPKSLLAEGVARKVTGLVKSTEEQPSAHQASHNMNGQWAPEERPPRPPCSPDVSTVAALSEVKVLLRSVLSASEDLRRSISRQTTEGLDLLQLLHQRFSVLLRRLNSEPDTGQSLASEFQELENLVENSYSSILHAQNVFIASCHRIQDEEPLVEAKITDILDKIVTSIELGHQYNREQLGELRQLVRRMGSFNSSLEIPAVSTMASPRPALLSSPNERELREALTRVVRSVNSTSERLGSVAGRVAQVQNHLLSTSLEPLADRKDLADQLLTSAKDLYGYARHQLQVLSDLRLTVQRALSARPSEDNPQALSLRDSVANSHNVIRLPAECTDALRPLLHYEKSEVGNKTKASVTTDDDSLPVWYTDPDIVSGNYGTPQRRFPSFRDDDWSDSYDEYHQDYQEDIYDLETSEVKNSNETVSKSSEAIGNKALGETRIQPFNEVNVIPPILRKITHEAEDNLTASETL